MKVLTLLILMLSAPARAAQTQDIPLQIDFQVDPDPVTTDQIVALDPEVINPHRQRFVVERKLEIRGLEPFKIGEDNFGVRASGLSGSVRLHVRGTGPWYRPMSEFPCTREPQEWFATEGGAQAGGKAAADLWTSTIDSDRMKLSLAMERMRAETPELVLAKGKKLFQLWWRGESRAWHEKVRKEGRTAEWKTYQEAAKAESVCTGSGHSAQAPVRWEEMMEPPAASGNNQILARAPARRWDGLFSIRVQVIAADKRLDGKFLVDSEAEQSLMSPEWLVKQGVNPKLIEVANAPLQKINWGGENKLARKVEVEAVTLGGAPVALNQFFVRKTELFDEPDNVATCCDGVLGRDFLRLFSVEFKPGPPAEVVLWKPEGYHEGEGWTWVEAADVPNLGIQSECRTSSGDVRIPGVFWDTGSDIGATFHSAWRTVAKTRKSWDLDCGYVSIAHHLEHDSKVETESGGRTDALSMKDPGVTIGMPVLARGPFTIDLPHGRMWMARPALASGILVNKSGLRLEYRDEEGDRVLRVTEVSGAPGSPSSELTKMGMRKGLRIYEVDGKSVDEMDLWNIEQRLAGAYGKVVILKWKTANGIKIGALRVR